jgi:hypothetical protein
LAGNTLDFYCETGDGVEKVWAKDDKGELRNQFGHVYASSPTFLGQSREECAKQARAKGWRLDFKTMRALCPVCIRNNLNLGAK